MPAPRFDPLGQRHPDPGRRHRRRQNEAGQTQAHGAQIRARAGIGQSSDDRGEDQGDQYHRDQAEENLPRQGQPAPDRFGGFRGQPARIGPEHDPDREAEHHTREHLRPEARPDPGAHAEPLVTDMDARLRGDLGHGLSPPGRSDEIFCSWRRA